MFETNRVIKDCGARFPIFQAPMGWIARSPLVSAVSRAGGLGIMETSSKDFDAIKVELKIMSSLTNAPFAVNLPLHFLKQNDSIVDDVLASGVKFVTTSAGDPGVYARRLKSAGIKVYHAVPSVYGALKAVDAGVDGLIVEGGESASFRSPQEIGTFVLLQAVRRQVDLPIVAAGGIANGHGMAAAFALGAEGVQLGTRFVACNESPAHAGYKEAILKADTTSTVVTNRGVGPCVRALRSKLTDKILAGEISVPSALKNIKDLYFGGDMEASLGSAGESSALIDREESAAAIIDGMVAEFQQTIQKLAAQFS